MTPVKVGVVTPCALIHVPRVDKDRSGAISSDELQQALSNGEYCVLGGRKGGREVLPVSLLNLASHTFRRERKGLVTLQPSSCRHDRNLSGPIRSALFVDRICCHGVQLRHNVFSGCQHLITEPQWSIIAFLGDNSVVAA